MHQLSFEGITHQNRTRKIRKQQFLEQVEQIMPWAMLLAPLKAH